MREILEKKLTQSLSSYHKYVKNYMKSCKKQDRDLSIYYNTRVEIIEELLKIVI